MSGVRAEDFEIAQRVLSGVCDFKSREIRADAVSTAYDDFR
jgi:hypothetical protein